MNGTDEHTPENEPTERERELQQRADDLQRQLDEANANRSPATTRPGGATTSAPQTKLAPDHVELNAGDHCPLCTYGLLFLIGEAEDSVLLRCFNCSTQGSHRPSVGHQLVVNNPRQTPTGFTLSRAQYAARGAADPEEAAASHLAPEQGSGVTPVRTEYEGA